MQERIPFFYSAFILLRVHMVCRAMVYRPRERSGDSYSLEDRKKPKVL